MEILAASRNRRMLRQGFLLGCWIVIAGTRIGEVASFLVDTGRRHHTSTLLPSFSGRHESYLGRTFPSFISNGPQPSTWRSQSELLSPAFSDKQCVGRGHSAPMGACLSLRFRGRTRLWTLAKSSTTEEFVEAEDLDALQALFSEYCDDDGLMTRTAVENIPAIMTLLTDGDLLLEEFYDIWDKAPKFPESSKEERIDVDSFVQVYRDIDDLFEEDDDETDDSDGSRKDGDDGSVEEEPTSAASQPEIKPIVTSNTEAAETETVVDTEDTDDSTTDDGLEAELESIFAVIADQDGLISKERLRVWDEVEALILDGMLSEEEFEQLWKQTNKSPGSTEQLDVDGFLSFNVALDGLFDFEDEDTEKEEDDVVDDEEEVEAAMQVETEGSGAPEGGDDLSPGALFQILKDDSGLVGQDDLTNWSELQEMLADGDLLSSELESMFDSAPKSASDVSKLDEAGFAVLWKAVNDLFEYDDDDDDEGTQSSSDTTMSSVSEPSSSKPDLLRALELLNDDEDRLPCGLESSEAEQQVVLDMVNKLETEPSNLVRQRQGNIATSDLAGTWDMLYTSSSAMKFNKGLTGLGGTFPNGQFGGLKQTLKVSKLVTDVEYREHIEVNPSTASFDVKVTGDCDLRTSVSLFTGEPSIVLSVVPDRVEYGPTSTRADHWKSLGPLNMLDVTYLDEDLRIMRGNTAVDTLFIFRRSQTS